MHILHTYELNEPFPYFEKFKFTEYYMLTMNYLYNSRLQKVKSPDATKSSDSSTLGSSIKQKLEKNFVDQRARVTRDPAVPLVGDESRVPENISSLLRDICKVRY